MSAPMTTARGTPGGIKLTDGFSTKIAFSVQPALDIWEMTASPPGLDGGDAIETTTMFNQVYRTKSARSLKTQTDSAVKAAYASRCYPQLLDMINVMQAITFHYPNGDTLDFFGFLQKAEFEPLEEGKFPQGTFTIVATNQDPVTGVEQGAVFTTAAGTLEA